MCRAPGDKPGCCEWPLGPQRPCCKHPWGVTVCPSCRSCFEQLPNTGSRTGLKSGQRCRVEAMPSAEIGESDAPGLGPGWGRRVGRADLLARGAGVPGHPDREAGEPSCETRPPHRPSSPRAPGAAALSPAVPAPLPGRAGPGPQRAASAAPLLGLLCLVHGCGGGPFPHCTALPSRCAALCWSVCSLSCAATATLLFRTFSSRHKGVSFPKQKTDNSRTRVSREDTRSPWALGRC